MLIKAGWERTFVAEIYREKTEDGKDVIYGNVVVNEGKIWCAAETQDELGRFLDDICLLKLDLGLHLNPGVTTEIFDTNFFLN